MTVSRLDPPRALDLIPAEQVRDIIARTDHELTELERSAEDAHGTAERAERAVREAGLDPESSAWTMVRLQRFLEGLRDETQRDVETMLELARQQARIQLTEMPGASAVPSPVPAPVRGDRAEPVAPVVLERPASPPAPSDPLPPVTAVAVGGAVAVATEPMAEPAFAQPEVQPVEPEPAPRLVVVPPAVDEPASAPAPVVVPNAPDDAPRPAPAAARAPAPAASAPVVAAEKKAGLLHRLPISAILEVIAVLLILVFILLRLS